MTYQAEPRRNVPLARVETKECPRIRRGRGWGTSVPVVLRTSGVAYDVTGFVVANAFLAVRIKYSRFP